MRWVTWRITTACPCCEELLGELMMRVESIDNAGDLHTIGGLVGRCWTKPVGEQPGTERVLN
jgi:hypothetical protein